MRKSTYNPFSSDSPEPLRIIPLLNNQMSPDQSRRINLFMILIFAMTMIPWVLGEYQLLGFKITGWMWVIPMAVSVLVCLGSPRKICFPVGAWLPWTGVIGIYWFLGRHNPDALQSLLQTLSPLVVGCAASTFRPDGLWLERIIVWLTRLSWISWILFLFRTPMILAGMLPGHGLMAPEMIGLLLLGSCYSSFYACGSGRHLYYYLAVMVIPVMALTRGPIVAMLSCLPLTLAPLRSNKRVILCAVLLVVSLIIFNTDRVQTIMFQSGSGGIKDLYWNNPDFRTSGRSAMFDILWFGVEDRPILGNGFNSHRIDLLNAGLLYLPHNDWLKITFDMGILGLGCLLFGMVVQILRLLLVARETIGPQRMLAYAVASAFVPYALIMLTDNVLLYAQFFGNLHFALIGIVYGALQRNRVTENCLS